MQGKFKTRIRPYQPIEEARARAWNNGLEWRSVPGEPTAALAWRARGYGGVEQGRAQAASGGVRSREALRSCGGVKMTAWAGTSSASSSEIWD